MEGNEKLPDGWIRVQSKSRPDKVYFYHKDKKISLWKIEDIELLNQKVRLKQTKLQSPKKPAAMTIIKPVRGVAAESKVIKKNTAKERMEKLQKKLTDEVSRGIDHPASTAHKQHKIKINRHEDSIIKNIPAKILTGHKKFIRDAEDVKNSAAKRMKTLKNELKKEKSQNNCVTPAPGSSTGYKLKNVPNETKLKLPPDAAADEKQDVEMMDVSFSSEHISDYEPMEWEEIDEKIVLEEIQKIRRMNSTDDHISHRENFVSVVSDFYIIVDTNVLLSNIEFIKEIKGKMFKGKLLLNNLQDSNFSSPTDIGKATIFLPYIVLNELDRLKIRDGDVARLARRSIAFIDECFKQNDSFFTGQSAEESVKNQLIPIDSGDDEILNCCLQIQKNTRKIILLTNDKNLRNKAFVNKIESFSKDMLNFVHFNVKNDIKFD